MAVAQDPSRCHETGSAVCSDCHETWESIGAHKGPPIVGGSGCLALDLLELLGNSKSGVPIATGWEGSMPKAKRDGNGGLDDRGRASRRAGDRGDRAGDRRPQRCRRDGRDRRRRRHRRRGVRGGAAAGHRARRRGDVRAEISAEDGRGAEPAVPLDRSRRLQDRPEDHAKWWPRPRSRFTTSSPRFTPRAISIRRSRRAPSPAHCASERAGRGAAVAVSLARTIAAPVPERWLPGASGLRGVAATMYFRLQQSLERTS